MSNFPKVFQDLEYILSCLLMLLSYKEQLVRYMFLKVLKILWDSKFLKSYNFWPVVSNE